MVSYALLTNLADARSMWRGLVFLLLAACNGPSPHFRGVPATRVEVDGSVFDVRVRGNLAEAVRVNPQYAPRLGPIRARAAFAMAEVSGCRVRGVLGDQALTTGRLVCGDSDDRVTPVPMRASYSCIEVRAWIDEGPWRDYPEFDCDPV